MQTLTRKTSRKSSGFTLAEILVTTVILTGLVLIFGNVIAGGQAMISSTKRNQEYYNTGATLSTQISKDLATIPSYGFIEIKSDELVFLSMGEFICRDANGVEVDDSGNPFTTTIACVHYRYDSGSSSLLRNVYPMYKFTLADGTLIEADSPFNKTLEETKLLSSSMAMPSLTGPANNPPQDLADLQSSTNLVLMPSEWTGFQSVLTKSYTTNESWFSGSTDPWPRAVRLNFKLQLANQTAGEGEPIEIYSPVLR